MARMEPTMMAYPHTQYSCSGGMGSGGCGG